MDIITANDDSALVDFMNRRAVDRIVRVPGEERGHEEGETASL
jgi:hypothetical protein